MLYYFCVFLRSIVRFDIQVKQKRIWFDFRTRHNRHHLSATAPACVELLQQRLLGTAEGCWSLHFLLFQQVLRCFLALFGRLCSSPSPTKKSQGVRSGLLAGHAIGPPRPIHLLLKCLSIHCLTFLSKCAGAPSDISLSWGRWRKMGQTSLTSISKYLSAFMVSLIMNGPIRRSAVIPHQTVTLCFPTAFL